MPDAAPDNDLETTYERAFRSLLWRLQPRRLERHVARLIRNANACSEQGQGDEAAFASAYVAVRERVITRLVRNREALRAARADSPNANPHRAAQQTRLALQKSVMDRARPGESDFFCDSGLGGLARWLRAAGYDTRFWPQIDDDDLLQRTQASNAILLTTDRPLTERSAVTWGAVPALLVPLEIGKHAQFRFVAGRLGLKRKSPRCMACGGGLDQVDKEAVRERIPPKTYPWCDDYFECRRCGKLFWRGTHWQNVTRHLADALRR